MKYILVIGDGMADNPVPELGNKTPLEVAKKPCMDQLAGKGELGHVKNVPEGQPPGSDTAILSIFGCDPNLYYTGRAPLEAAAQGIALEAGDMACRCNMVCIEEVDKPFAERRILSHSAGSIDGELSLQLVNDLFEMPEFKAAAEKAGLSVYPTLSYRHIAVQKNADIRGLMLAPPHDHLGECIAQLLPHGGSNGETLRELMELANRLLTHHSINEKRRAEGKMPANGIWFWAEGTAVKLPSFTEAYGKSGTVISAVPLCHGIAALIGLDRISVEGATGEIDTNYEGKAEAAVQALRDGYDFVAVHVEAPDECTHNGDTDGKILSIEYLDSRMLAILVARLAEEKMDYRMLILSDHKTLTSTRGHDGDPVPYLIYDSTKDSGAGLAYTEANGEKGRYVDAGVKLMGMLFESDKK